MLPRAAHVCNPAGAQYYSVLDCETLQRWMPTGYGHSSIHGAFAAIHQLWKVLAMLHDSVRHCKGMALQVRGAQLRQESVIPVASWVLDGNAGGLASRAIQPDGSFTRPAVSDHSGNVAVQQQHLSALPIEALSQPHEQECQ